MPRLYHFEFEGIAKKITIQVNSGGSKRARELLSQRLANLPEYDGKRIIEETTESLVAGVSKRKIGDKMNVWTGSSWTPV